ncbi:tetratricopeptide repeat protein [Streptomyces sp. E11-3]|uniref:tetratricopeptide repeat protein n=1 Tax=Streptomyces sp. E11-3 TaxID=3110112 RepID=UPI0039804ACF
MTTTHPDVDRAVALIDAGRHEDAAVLLGRRLAESPDDTRALANLARCHLDADRPQEAVEVSAKALEHDPGYVFALLVHAEAVRRAGLGIDKALALLHEAVRLAPDYWYGYAKLAQLTGRRALLRYAQESGKQDLTGEDMAHVFPEAAALAEEAIRLGPDEVYAYEVAREIANFSGATEDVDRFDRAILRLDPTHEEALANQTRRAANGPEVTAAKASTLYADALAAAPDSSAMRGGLDHATYRLLRGTRWLAVLCVVLGGGMINLFPTGEGPTLPVPLGERLWFLVVMGAIWALGAWRSYRRLRTGVQLNVRSLIRRELWARIVLAQTACTMLCALLIAQVPWTDRTVPQILFWTGLVVPWLTISSDRDKIQ